MILSGLRTQAVFLGNLAEDAIILHLHIAREKNSSVFFVVVDVIITYDLVELFLRQ